MLVSIVTPSYNQAEYLEATIQSVLAQEYADLEYIIVDGGSTDGSLEIIQKYASQLSWWVSEPDRGQADGINKGLRRARGEVVAWLNSDDLYLPGTIQAAVKAMQAEPDAGIVFGDAITIDPAGRPLNILSFGDWGLRELMRFHIICQPAVFMRRAALERVDYLDENFHYMLDHHLWLRIARSDPVTHIPALWAAARHHPAAKNVSLAPKFSMETYRVLAWIKTHHDFQFSYQADRRRITGGAHRLAARYFLDGGQRLKALSTYGKSLLYWPSYAVKHWHRMAYAILSLASFGRADQQLIQRSRRQPPRLEDARLHGWPGLSI